MAVPTAQEVFPPMLHSMTGYGRGQAERDGLRVRAEVRTVNHRYLDVTVRLSHAFAVLEEPVRRTARAKLARGRVDISLHMEDTREQAQSVTVNVPLLEAYAAAAEHVRSRFYPDGAPDLSWLPTVPGVLVPAADDEDPAVWEPVVDAALGQALDGVIAMRRREGEQLQRQLASGLDKLGQLVEAIAARAPAQVAGIQERLRQRLETSVGPELVDEQRLAMEVALLADKADVAEELTRLSSHLKQFRTILEHSTPPVGRQLDFLAQEIHRELTTIGAKSVDVGISDRIVTAKVEVERLREQVQNIE